MEEEKSPAAEPVFKEPSPKKKKKVDAEQTSSFAEETVREIKPQLKHEAEFLRSIPSSSQYEKSFMHRDTISHVIATKTDFIVTASVDGHLKFWKKKHGEGVEFVKHFRCHLSEFSHVCANIDGTLLATVCEADKSVKVFDIENFDMINMIKLDFPPRTAHWVHQSNDPIAYLAIGAADSGKVIVVDGKATATPVCEKEKLHSCPVKIIQVSRFFLKINISLLVFSTVTLSTSSSPSTIPE